jgi:putative addiction module killer protein
MGYTPAPFDVLMSASFEAWYTGLADRLGRARISARLDRLALGNPGDVKPVGRGISELRIAHGPGYRVYFRQRGPRLVVILYGGTKQTQANDIRRAIAIDDDWRE